MSITLSTCYAKSREEIYHDFDVLIFNRVDYKLTICLALDVTIKPYGTFTCDVRTVLFYGPTHLSTLFLCITHIFVTKI